MLTNNTSFILIQCFFIKTEPDGPYNKHEEQLEKLEKRITYTSGKTLLAHLYLDNLVFIQIYLSQIALHVDPIVFFLFYYM